MLLYPMIIMYVLFWTYSEFDQVRDCYLASDHHILVVFSWRIVLYSELLRPH